MTVASFWLTLFFWMLTGFGCVFALVFGGRDGRWFTTAFLGCVLLTIPAQLAGSWHATQIWLMLVDALLLGCLIWLMMRSNRYWPIWAAASQLMTVLTHVVTMMLPGFSERIYAGLSTVWVIPLLLFTIIGIELDRKKINDRAYPA